LLQNAAIHPPEQAQDDSMTQRLDGKTALVTGASSGLGERFATVLAAAGARVAIAARRADRLAALAQRIAASGGRAQPVSMDVTRVASIAEGVAAAEAALGAIDILVNNSGVAVERRLGGYSEADYDHVMDTNLKGSFFVAQEVGRRMIEAKRPGRIINIASAAGLRPVSTLGVYGMSKAGLAFMTRAMASEWARHGICVNAMCPGYIKTEINAAHWETEGGKKLIAMLPRRRIGNPEDLDDLLLLLAADTGRLINGAIIPADDGYAAG
jgi:NAD(P)-dependent dehydrogenase (short-subunit alcohol dehydrogenase family)